MCVCFVRAREFTYPGRRRRHAAVLKERLEVLKGYMAVGYLLFLQEQIKDIIITIHTQTHHHHHHTHPNTSSSPYTPKHIIIITIHTQTPAALKHQTPAALKHTPQEGRMHYTLSMPALLPVHACNCTAAPSTAGRSWSRSPASAAQSAARPGHTLIIFIHTHVHKPHISCWQNRFKNLTSAMYALSSHGPCTIVPGPSPPRSQICGAAASCSPTVIVPAVSPSLRASTFLNVSSVCFISSRPDSQDFAAVHVV